MLVISIGWKVSVEKLRKLQVSVENQSPVITSRIEEIRDIIKEKGALKMPEVHVHFAVNTFRPDESEKERVKQLEEKGNYFVYFYE